MAAPLSPSSSGGKFVEVLEAHVVGFCRKAHIKRKKHYAVYQIDVSFAAAQWTIQRRFSEFVKFCSNLKSAFPTLRLLSLPSRMHKSLDPSFLEKRRQKLNSFMIDVLDQVPLVGSILKCEVIMQFLEVMKHLEKHFALDKRTKGREFFPDLYASFPFNKKTIHLTIQHGMDKGEDIPIHIASKEGNCEEISAIVKADPETMYVTDFLGQTAVHVASRHGQAPVIRLLLVLGADRNIQDKRGWSPLHCASTSADLQSVLTLLEDESVIPDLQNVDGNTPLHYFVRNFSSSPPDMLKDVLAIFEKKGSDVNAQNKSGETPLHHACWRGSFPLVATLLAAGANPNLLTVTGESPLQWAMREGKTNIGHFLIQNGAITDKSLFDPALPAQSGTENSVNDGTSSAVDDVTVDEEEFDDDDGSDSSDDEVLDRPKNGKPKTNHKHSESEASSPSSTPSSASPSTPPNFYPASHAPNFYPSTSNFYPSNNPNLSPPSSLSSNSSSPSTTSSTNFTPPGTSPPQKFVAGTHSRNTAPGTFLPVLASPKRLLRPAEHEIHQHQLQQQLLQLSPQSQVSQTSQLSQISQLSPPPQFSQPPQNSQSDATQPPPPPLHLSHSPAEPTHSHTDPTHPTHEITPTSPQRTATHRRRSAQVAARPGGLTSPSFLPLSASAPSRDLPKLDDIPELPQLDIAENSNFEITEEANHKSEITEDSNPKVEVAENTNSKSETAENTNSKFELAENTNLQVTATTNPESELLENSNSEPCTGIENGIESLSIQNTDER